MGPPTARGGRGGDPGPINKNQQLRLKQAKTDYNRMEVIWANLLIDWTKLQQTITGYKLRIGLITQRSRVQIPPPQPIESTTYNDWPKRILVHFGPTQAHQRFQCTDQSGSLRSAGGFFSKH